MMKNNKTTRRRLPAEWEPAGAILMAWPHDDTDWAYMLSEAEACYVEIIRQITVDTPVILLAPDPARPRQLLADAGVNTSMVFMVTMPTDDTWTRDYGPITVTVDDAPVALDFQFNGWGLKFAAANDNRATSRLLQAGVLQCDAENRLDFVLEGGSIESDGCGTLLTTTGCLTAPNRNATMTREEIMEYLAEALGAHHQLWLDSGELEGDDTDGHIDTLARLAPDDTIIYTGAPDDPDDPHYGPLTAMAAQLRELRTPDGQPYNLIELPLPDPCYDEDGKRLPATYANFLIVNNAIILPVYNSPKKDFLASTILKIAFPGYDIRKVDCRALIRQHGSLHCATMQLHPATLKFLG